MRIEHFTDREAWKSEKAYAVAGAKVAAVELDPAGETA